jgi:predicted ATP-dependent endonuclease of OLD family
VNLVAFRIFSFRSIIDSNWIPFSHDGITVFVGQNESGKSSVLEALYYALSTESPTSDDVRIGSGPPRVHLRIRIEQSEIAGKELSLDDFQRKVVCRFLKENNDQIEIESSWTKSADTNKYVQSIRAVDARLEKIIEEEKLTANRTNSDVVELSLASHDDSEDPNVDNELPSENHDNQTIETDITYELWYQLPLGVLFNEESGHLPSQVDINDDFEPTGLGARAALNFLLIAEISLPALLNGDRRARENTLAKANTKVSEDFKKFWSQTIGQTGSLSLKCQIDHYSASASEQTKVGKPHLVFWICDGTNQLYPNQRSKGVRWFISFYLQLKASEKAKNKRVFLLDEPGANLHSKAQGDVLKLVNQLGKDTSTVVYSTHSPQMLEYAKLYRVHAVQRDDLADDSPTSIVDAHRLGTASTDTLSPVLMAMGTDLSHQQVIRKTNNVLLEEMSGYYYLTSFLGASKNRQGSIFYCGNRSE